MIFVKKFKSNEKFKEFLSNSKKMIFYNIETEEKKVFYTSLVVMFFEIDDVLNFCNNKTKNIVEDILLIKNYEMSFSYLGNKKILINLKFNEVSLNFNIIDFILTLETILHIYISRQFQNDFKVNVFYNFDDLFLTDSLKKIITKVLTAKNAIVLPIMNKNQRKIVHKYVSKYPNLISKSIGPENNRQISIKYNDKI